MPDLPEQSRASREDDAPRPGDGEVVPERRAVETAVGGLPDKAAPPNPPPSSPPTQPSTQPSTNGSHGRLDDPLTAPADPFGGRGGDTDTETGTGTGTEAEAKPEAKPEADDAGGSDSTEGTDGDADGDGKGRRRRSGWRSAIEWALVIGGALLVALVVRTFLVQAFWIPSASMEPTLHEGDRVLVNKLSYDLHDVRHGDVIVFERPDEPSDVPHPEDEIPDLIKRVIALPGDVIEGRDGVVYINDEPLDEPYLAPDTPTTDLPRQEIPPGKVFVMGDNRTNSHDSRRFGPIDESSIVGRAFLRIYPLDDIGGL